jgi:tRNA nucleotidyltransferase (CCA-adding enzyme)
MEDFMNLEDILKEIYPDDNQNKCLTGIVSTLGDILKNGSGYLKIKKVIPAGSLAKNTILKGHLEVDCVYILEHNGYSFANNFFEVRRALLDNLPGVTFSINRHSISFVLHKGIGDVSVDLLPAFEINDQSQILQVKNKDAYYGSTALLQKKYFKKACQYYPRFTDLIRLLKLWRNTWNIPLSSYMLEVIASDAICETDKDASLCIHLEVCFRIIQSFTDSRWILPVFSKDYNDSQVNYRNSQSNLWIIDPSDYSENLAEDITHDEKQVIRSEATRAVSYLHNNEVSFLGDF